MSKFRTVLVSALAISSLLAGGIAAHAQTSHSPAHHLAGPAECCEDGANF
jgi:hypothetical protein